MIVNQTTNNPNFTSIIPVKVFENGQQVLTHSANERALKLLQNSLTNDAVGNPDIITLKKAFMLDRDFDRTHFIYSINPNNPQETYIFTGPQKDVFGPLKNKFEEIKRLISSGLYDSARIREGRDGRVYSGDFVELHINTESPIIKNISFDKLGTNAQDKIVDSKEIHTYRPTKTRNAVPIEIKTRIQTEHKKETNGQLDLFS